MTAAPSTCASCGSALHDGAMFCGECGRAVVSGASSPLAFLRRGSRRSTPPRSELVDPPTFLPDEAGDDGNTVPVVLDPAATPAALAEEKADEPDVRASRDLTQDDAVPATGPDVHDDVIVPELSCDQCGAALAHDDIFCPECGQVASGIALAFARQRDTAVVEPVLDRTGTDPATDGSDDDEAQATSAFDAILNDPASARPTTAAPPTTDLARRRPLLPRTSGRDGLETTTIDSSALPGPRFILQFSTGESVAVSGSGLIGRNPVPEPDEYFRQLVRLFDPGRSVSKTHLEFGEDDGVFWVRDRYSGNGTVVREPEAPPRRAEAGRRVHLARGSRVEIGEQFFVVS